MKTKLTNEEQEELDEAIELMDNPLAFEYYCRACDYFQTDDCPFKNKVQDNTQWRYIKCNHFMD